MKSFTIALACLATSAIAAPLVPGTPVGLGDCKCNSTGVSSPGAGAPAASSGVPTAPTVVPSVPSSSSTGVPNGNYAPGGVAAGAAGGAAAVVSGAGAPGAPGAGAPGNSSSSGSGVAYPEVPSLTVALELCANLQIAIGADVQLLVGKLQGLKGNAGEVTPVVKEKLAGIAVQLKAIIGTVVPAVIGHAKVYTSAELYILLGLVKDLDALLAQVEICLKALVGTAEADVIIAVKAELQLILQLVVAVSTPIAQVALEVVAATGVPAIVAEITVHAKSMTACSERLIEVNGEICGKLPAGVTLAH
ncbi:hypothetical protein QBC46DRAFT_341780 [Diplogelasinospora grovesii]|uniref:Cell wall protein n=1 Tax=Diplogelasinospora grovesii TaxID=303347 RepID=A0AAN6N6Q6_9PEZI|nr:hypothetical protein QBC46DRAFT_341780 [Diplogelasinospora grovesii]